jgi:preprotein translocase subunit SecG
MGFVIGILTVVLVLDCAALILLVLIQLPKKEAGMGLAFGGAATDALFGAGSGNVLTKITKYAAGVFFVLAIVLSLLQSQYHRRTTNEFKDALGKAGSAAPTSLVQPAPTPATPTTPAAVPAPGTNLLTVPPSVEATNIPVAPAPPRTAPATNK